MIKVCVLTGTRAEYGLLKPVMKEIKNHPKLKLFVIATGMHLSKEFGYSVKEIEKDGFKISARVKMNPEKDTGFSMAESMGKGIAGIANAMKKIKPDFLVVLGDRTEAFAGAIAAVYMNIPIAHLHGGDISRAGIDESVRHAITKLANIHFPATKKSAERIRKMGESNWRINIVGAPCMDTILNAKLFDKKWIGKKFGIIPEEKFIIVVQHPVTTESEKAGMQMKETLDAVIKSKVQTILIYPNSDSGARKMITQIKKQAGKQIIVCKNLSQKEYLSILKFSGGILGNSSSGVIESTAFGIPAINIGIRQDGRERSTNVINTPHDAKKIENAIRKALFDKNFIKKAKNAKIIYGNGTTGKKICQILAKTNINQKLLQKKNFDN
ncbi:MAG: UDP-N-acetylglucosamine 2-epimerase [archaeon]|nr:UDP-N-acetylglucosamine 2-epimerase [archaeon]